MLGIWQIVVRDMSSYCKRAENEFCYVQIAKVIQ